MRKSKDLTQRRKGTKQYFDGVTLGVRDDEIRYYTHFGRMVYHVTS